jgi:voltage-gated potassium channel
MERFNARMRLPIIVSAILPLILVSETNGWIVDTVDIVTWLVFLVDYVVHVRHLAHYRRSGYGRLDLLVVIVTAPWFLIPGAGAGGFVVLFRLARLARLVVASRGARRLFDRLGRIVAVAAGVVVLGSLVAYYAEHPVNPEFATFGDSLWWGIVTLTTVGYGDIVPQTPTGRWAAVVIMVTGIAVLGVLAGALSSFFRLDESRADDEPAAGEPAMPADVAITALTAEVAALRRQVEALAQLLTRTSAGQLPEEPPPGEGGLDLSRDPAATRRRRIVPLAPLAGLEHAVGANGLAGDGLARQQAQCSARVNSAPYPGRAGPCSPTAQNWPVPGTLVAAQKTSELVLPPYGFTVGCTIHRTPS